MLQVLVAFERHHFCPSLESDRRAGFNPGNQISRHGFGEPWPANQQIDVLGDPREEDRCLAGGVSSSDDGHLLAAAQLAFHLRRAVVDADAFELREVRQIQFSILRARRHDDAAALHGSSIVEFDRVRRAPALEPAGARRTRSNSTMEDPCRAAASSWRRARNIENWICRTSRSSKASASTTARRKWKASCAAARRWPSSEEETPPAKQRSSSRGSPSKSICWSAGQGSPKPCRDI